MSNSYRNCYALYMALLQWLEHIAHIAHFKKSFPKIMRNSQFVDVLLDKTKFFGSKNTSVDENAF